MKSFYSIISDTWRDKCVEGKRAIHAAGVLTLAIGVAQLLVTIETYRYISHPRDGLFWSSIFTILTGLFGSLLPTNKLMIIFCMLFSVIGAVLDFISVVQDSTATGIVDSLEACVYSYDLFGFDDYRYYGNEKFHLNAAYCTTAYWKKDIDCYCVNSDNKCYLYTGAPDNDCGNVLVGYLQRLSVSSYISLIAMVSCVNVFILTNILLFIITPNKAVVMPVADDECPAQRIHTKPDYYQEEGLCSTIWSVVSICLPTRMHNSRLITIMPMDELVHEQSVPVGLASIQ